MRGWHWAFYREGPVVNIPYGPHRILVLGIGRLTRRGRYFRWLPGGVFHHLDFCCPARLAQRDAEIARETL